MIKVETQASPHPSHDKSGDASVPHPSHDKSKRKKKKSKKRKIKIFHVVTRGWVLNAIFFVVKIDVNHL